MVVAVRKDDQLAILGRAINSEGHDWPDHVAEAIMSIAITEADRNRMHTLAKLAQAGELSASEESEIESYRQANRFLDFLKAKARNSLARSIRS